MLCHSRIQSNQYTLYNFYGFQCNDGLLNVTGEIQRKRDASVRPFCLRSEVCVWVRVWQYVVPADSCSDRPRVHQ